MYDMRDQLAALKSLASQPHPTLGIDIDGVIDEARMFFNILSHIWPGKVIIVTFRSDAAKAEADLQKFKIRYDEVVLVKRLEDKAGVISEKGIAIYFDDQPECLKGIPEHVKVFLMRNGGNFDYSEQRWLVSDQTARFL